MSLTDMNKSASTAMQLKRIPLAVSAAVLLLLLAPLAAEGQDAPAPASTAGGLSTLRPGDVVRVRIWREEEMSGEFTVDERGVVVLPRLGPTQVTDVPVGEMKTRLEQAYGRYLQPGSVEITTLHRVRVTGAVRSPGLYPADLTMTVADVVALAGGATPAGKNEVIVMRDGARVGPALSLSAPVAQTPLRSGDHLLVPERSLLSRHPGLVLGAVSTAVSAYWIINRRR